MLGPGAGWALTTGITIAADPKASKPPANMPYRPRRTVFSDIFMKSPSQCATAWSLSEA
jgi:hypothetical protein